MESADLSPGLYPNRTGHIKFGILRDSRVFGSIVGIWLGLVCIAIGASLASMIFARPNPPSGGIVVPIAFVLVGVVAIFASAYALVVSIRRRRLIECGMGFDASCDFMLDPSREIVPLFEFAAEGRVRAIIRLSRVSSSRPSFRGLMVRFEVLRDESECIARGELKVMNWSAGTTHLSRYANLRLAGLTVDRPVRLVARIGSHHDDTETLYLEGRCDLRVISSDSPVELLWVSPSLLS